MGVIASYIERRLAEELDRRKVVVWYDPPRQWLPWVSQLYSGGGMPAEATVIDVTVGGRLAKVVTFAGSYYEVARVCEPLAGGEAPERLLVYLPGEPHLEALSPLRELECLSGDKEPWQPQLASLARSALQGAGLADSKIDALLSRQGLTFEYLDAVPVGEAGGASPLAPVFGSSRELDVVPSFLAEPGRRAEAKERGLLDEVARLAEQGLGLPLKATLDPDEMAHELGRLVLVAEMRSDLDGADPVALSQLPMPRTEAQLELVRKVCNRLRREHADSYEALADRVEQELDLADLDIDAERLGHIDTFRFEERRLLEACDRLLAEGSAQRALEIVEGRAGSFWTSVGRHPERHAVWRACGELARLALAIEEIEQALRRPPSKASGWAQAYTAPGGWHRVDQRFREARYLLGRAQDGAELERAAEHVFASYDALVDRMANGFVGALQAGGWQVREGISQTEVYSARVARRPQPVAYLLVDAMRYEMGVALGQLLEAAGAAAVRVEPAVAMAPTITDIGMAALLPGAECSFTIAESPRGVTGVIRGRALVGVQARMDHAKAEVPGLVEMTMDRLLHELSTKRLQRELKGAPVIVVRSQEIDGTGEQLSTGVAQRVMGTVLEDVRKAVLRLAEAGVEQFVVTADHGHLFGQRRGEDMRIDPPAGGQTVDLHRRCWVGRGGSTPSACVRLSAADLGYEGTDLDLVVPKGGGVFKARGSLAYHHGGLSLQELIIPVVSFELKGRRLSRARRGGDLVALEAVPKEISNLIFSLSIRRTDLALEPLRMRLIAEGKVGGETRTVGQAIFATSGWDPVARMLMLEGVDPVSVGIQIDDETVEELRVLVVQVGTDRTLKDTAPIPVKITR